MKTTNLYAKAITAFLQSRHISQRDFAEVIKKNQSAVSFYVNGKFLPERATAEKIEEVTMGEVPLSIWKLVALERAGIL